MDWYPNMRWEYLDRRILKIIHFPAQTFFKKKKKIFVDFDKYAKEKILQEEREEEAYLQEEKLQEEVEKENLGGTS